MIRRPTARDIEGAAACAASIVAITAYVHRFFLGYPGQTYPMILFIVAILAWRYSAVTAGIALGGVAMGIDIYVLEGEGLAIAKPEQAVGLAIMIVIGCGLIWAVRSAKHDRDQMRERLESVQRTADSRGEQLEELVHRIRNDLGAMSAMANVYGRSADPSSGLQAMGERIGVLGRLYQRLHVNDGKGSDIAMEVFLVEIVEDIRSTRLDLMPVSITTDFEHMVLPMRTASVVGMIMNEAVTNALKYAFPDDRQGRIEVSLHRLDDGRLCLRIEDDGVGPDGGPAKGTGMGTRLMRAMAAQIGGTYSMLREKDRTAVHIEFKGG